MSDAFRLISFAEIIDSASKEQAEARARREWGRWRLLPETWELAYETAPGRYRYLVDLERCGTSAAALDWIMQVSLKGWATRADVGQLVSALRDILDPQENLCSWAASKGGHGQTIDAPAHLRARYAGA